MRFLKRNEVANKVGVSGRYLNALVKQDNFPKPVRIGKTDCWHDREVDTWIKSKIAGRDCAGGEA